MIDKNMLCLKLHVKKKEKYHSFTHLVAGVLDFIIGRLSNKFCDIWISMSFLYCKIGNYEFTINEFSDEELLGLGFGSPELWRISTLANRTLPVQTATRTANSEPRTTSSREN